MAMLAPLPGPGPGPRAGAPERAALPRRAAPGGSRWRPSPRAAPAPAALAAAAAAAGAAAAAAAGRGRGRRRRLRAAADGKEGSDPAAERFLDWAARQGVEVSAKLGFARASYGLGGRCVVCGSAIDAGEVIVSLPASAAATVDLAPEAVAPDDLQPLASWWRKHPRASLRLAAKLAYERDRLGPYLGMLPQLEEIQAPWRWREEELRFLSKDVVELAAVRREALEKAAAELEALDCWTQSPRDLFLRANHAVTSRAFSGRDQAFASGPGTDAISLGVTVGAVLAATGAASQGLISVEAAALGSAAVAAASTAATATFGSREVLSVLPMVDQVNHVSGPPPDLVLTPSSRVWELRAHRAFNKGEEVVFSYGEKDNDTLLLQHGFVEEDNPSDAVALDVGEGLPLSEATRTAVEDQAVQKLRLERGGTALALAPAQDGDGYRPVELPQAALAEVAAAALRPAMEAVKSGDLSEAQDAAALSAAESAKRGDLIVLWRRERRRLLAEAAQRWLPGGA